MVKNIGWIVDILFKLLQVVRKKEIFFFLKINKIESWSNPE